MGKLTALALLVVATGCQPMYGNKSESLAKIKKVPHKAVPDLDPIIPYVDKCDTNFRGDPTRVSIDKPRATQLVGTGDSTIQQAEKIKDPQRTQLVVASIGHYSSALNKDPYDPDATLKLALAYDKVYRRGCALKLLGRISTLENHPRFRAAAHRVIESVNDTPEWFKGYRQNAINVLNGAAPAPNP